MHTEPPPPAPAGMKATCPGCEGAPQRTCPRQHRRCLECAIHGCGDDATTTTTTTTQTQEEDRPSMITDDDRPGRKRRPEAQLPPPDTVEEARARIARGYYDETRMIAPEEAEMLRHIRLAEEAAAANRGPLPLERQAEIHGALNMGAASIREVIASQVASGLAANPLWAYGRGELGEAKLSSQADRIAEHAVRIADSLLRRLLLVVAPQTEGEG